MIAYDYEDEERKDSQLEQNTGDPNRSLYEFRRDKRRIHDRFIEIISKGLHYYDHVDEIDLQTCKASDIVNLTDGWLDRYQSDRVFHNKVQSIVAELMKDL